MNRPEIILHMVTTVDGKVTGTFLSSDIGIKLSEEYYRIHREYNADAYLCGRVTFEGSFTFGRRPEYIGGECDPGDYIYGRFEKYAVVIDTHGRLGWEYNFIHDEDPGYDNAHIIEVVTESTPKPFLNYLRKLNISYIICGEKEVNADILAEKLYSLFGIKKLMLEGGGKTDSLFLQSGLINEISLVVAPVVDGGEGTDLFADKNGGLLAYSSAHTQELPYGGLHLVYKNYESKRR